MSATSEAIADNVLALVEDRFKRAGGVLDDTIRPRVRDLTLRMTDLSLRELAGEDVAEARAVVNASLANLGSATSALAAGAVRDGLRNAILGGIRLAFSLLV